MKSLFSMFSDCFNILSKNLTTLMWPILACLGTFLFIQSTFIDKLNLLTTSLNPLLILLIGVMVAISSSFLAGIYAMAYQAVLRALKPSPKSEEKINPFESLTLLGEFFPGVGAFFPSFFFGGLIHLAFVIALLFVMGSIIQSWDSTPIAFAKLLSLESAEQLQQLVLHPTADMAEFFEALSLVILGGAGVYGLFGLFTMFWPAYVIRDNLSAPAAYTRSFIQFFKDPIRVLSIGLGYTLLLVLLNMLALGSNIFVSTLQQLLVLMSHIWFLLVVCYYAVITQPKDSNGKDNTGSKLSIDA